MILGIQILKRLEAKIETMGLSPDRERQAKWALGLIVPEVKKIVDEEVWRAKAILADELRKKNEP